MEPDAVQLCVAAYCTTVYLAAGMVKLWVAVMEVAYSTMMFLSLDPVAAVRRLAGLVSTVEINYENIHRMQADYPSALSFIRRSLVEAIKNGLKPLALHAPYEEYFLPMIGAGLRRVIEEAKLVIDVAANYDVKYVVFHPFSAMRVGYGRVEWLNKLVFTELADYARNYGIVVAVENTVSVRPWNRVENVARLVQGIGSKSLALCLDVGHAWVNGYNPSKTVEEYHDIIRVIHLHDNDGLADKHLIPGAGTINWLKFSKALRTLPSSTVVVPEIACTSSDTSYCEARSWVSKAVVETIVKGYKG